MATIESELPHTQLHPKKGSTKNIVAVTLGNGLEIYDFIIYSFFSVTIGKLFFPSQDGYLSFLLSVATFGVGFFARPLGSFLLGAYADRYGRKSALTLIIGLMTLGTLMICVVPTYAKIGIWAPVILILARLIQGFSAGGEIGAATTYLMEAGAKQSRGVRVSWQMSSQGAAALLGTLMGATVTQLLTEQQVLDWGWRLPFIFGLLIMPIGMYVRSQLEETHPATAETILTNPLSTLWHGYKKEVILGIFVMMKATTSVYIIIHYMPSYLVQVLHMPASTSYWSSIITSTLLMVVPVLSGLLLDKLQYRKPLLLIISVISLLFIYPMYWAISNVEQMSVALTLIAIEQFISNFGVVALLLIFLESFPATIRATGLSIIYGLGVTIFGGFAQFNVTLLLKQTQDPMSPAWYLLFSGIISLIALIFYHERPQHLRYKD